jgi:tetratricopeptide (TPR) repeat protein
MAPEQSEGKTGALGPATDVYALGAILYELLTGRPPFRAATMVETLDQVRTQDPVAPTQLQPKLPRDLETICLKCLQKESAKRYASAQALADDLARFLAGEPIVARPTSVWERGIKWVRRRPTAAALVAVTAMAIVSLVATLAVSNVRIGREKDRADDNYRLAQTRRQAAEASLETALDAVERMLTRVGSQQLVRVPQTEGLRRRLLEDALDLQRKLLDDNGTDPAVRLRTGRGHRVLAGIHEMRGDFEKAKTHYDRAEAVLQKLVEEEPGSATYQHQLALVYRNQGKLLYLHRSRNLEAGDAYAQAMQLFQKLVDAHPDVALYRAELARSQTGWCAVAKALGNHEAADAVSEQMEKLLLPLVATFPGEEDYLWQLASLYGNRGDGFYRRGRLREAEEPARKAVEMLEKLLTKAPDVPAYRRDHVNCLVSLGMILIAHGKASEAEPFLGRGRKLVDKLISDYPTVLDYKRVRSASLHWLGRMYRSMGRLGEAEEALSEAASAWRNLVKQYPGQPTHRYRLAMSLLRLGENCRDRGRLDDAFKILSEALDLYSQQVRESPREVTNQQQLAATWHSVGTVAFRQANYAKAEEAFGQALAIQQRLSAKAPAVPIYRRDLANTRAHLGKTLRALGRSDAAAQAFAQASSGWRELVTAESGSSDYRNGLAETLAEMGDHEGAAKEAAELVCIGQGQAATFYYAADILAICVQTVLTDSSVPEAQRRELSQGYADQAMDLLRKAIAKGYRGIELLKNDPDFDSLRLREDFKKLLEEPEATQPNTTPAGEQ